MQEPPAEGLDLAEQRISVMTNSPSLARELEKYPRDGGHRHVVHSGERLRKAQEYPDTCCKVVLKAVSGDINKKVFVTDITREI